MRAPVVAAALILLLPSKIVLARAAPPSQPSSQPSTQPPSQPSTQPSTQPISRPAAPVYETRVTGRPLRRRAPADDPASFSTRVETSPSARGDLPQLLAEVPGLKIRDYGGGQPQTVLLRGAESHRVAVFLDGVRLNLPGGGGVDLALFDAGQLAAVEVRRSAGSVRFGEAALGGAVLLETPKLRRSRQTRLSLGYGSFDTLIGRASHRGHLGPVRLLVSGSYRQSDGDFRFVNSLNGVEDVRVNNDARVGEALLKADLDYGDWRFSWLESFLVGERGMPGPFAGKQDTRQRDLRNVLALQARLLDPWVEGATLNLSLSHLLQRLRFDADALAERSRNALHGLGVRASLMLPLEGYGRLDLGLETRGELFVDQLEAMEATVGDHARLLIDSWLGAQFRFFSERLSLLPALRLVSASDFGATVLPKLGLVLALWRSSRARLELLGNVGRSVRYPSFYELYARFEGVRGDPSLAPEDALSADGGLRLALRWLTVEAAYFRRLLVDAIRFVQLGSLTIAATNVGRVDVQGVEAALTLRPWRCVGLRGAYTFTDTRWGARDYRLPGQPRQRLAGRLAWDGPSCGRRGRGLPSPLKALRLYLAVEWQDQQVLGLFNSFEQPPRVLLGVAGAYSYRWLTLSVEGRNLLDVRDAVDVLGFPLPPARFFVTLSLRFS